jgi:hypothetical protein
MNDGSPVFAELDRVGAGTTPVLLHMLLRLSVPPRFP